MDKNKTKLSLEEEIFQAVKEGTIESKMSIIRLKAAQAGLTEENLDTLIQQCQQRLQREKGAMAIIVKHKMALSTCILAIFALEWYFGMKAEWGVIWILLTNLVSALVVVLGVSFVINRKLKTKH